MSDGAHFGMNAETAMHQIMGADEEPELSSTQQLAARVRATTTDPDTYGGTADYTAYQILTWLEADPHRAQFPTENVYEKDENGRMKWPAVILEHGWGDRMEEDGIVISKELTGFMWGWAVNAARAILELPPVPNPAIVTINIPESEEQ